jgi:hypothetical protein
MKSKKVRTVSKKNNKKEKGKKIEIKGKMKEKKVGLFTLLLQEE